MSNQAITWAYRQAITGGGKFVLVALADMADEAHSCFPGQKKLATMTGQTDRTVRRQLAELEIAGFIKRQRRFDGAGHRTSDRYTLPVDADVLIPTGQVDHRSETPQVRKTTGETDHRTVRPPVRKSSPTGHKDRVSLSEPPLTPQPPADAGAAGTPDHCPKHSRFRKGCDPCARAMAASKARPPWCGDCDEETRLVYDHDAATARRCTECHPTRLVSVAGRPQNQAAM